MVWFWCIVYPSLYQYIIQLVYNVFNLIIHSQSWKAAKVCNVNALINQNISTESIELARTLRIWDASHTKVPIEKGMTAHITTLSENSVFSFRIAEGEGGSDLGPAFVLESNDNHEIQGNNTPQELLVSHCSSLGDNPYFLGTLAWDVFRTTAT